MLNFIATDLKLYNIFKIMRVSFLGHIVYDILLFYAPQRVHYVYTCRVRPVDRPALWPVLCCAVQTSSRQRTLSGRVTPFLYHYGLAVYYAALAMI